MGHYMLGYDFYKHNILIVLISQLQHSSHKKSITILSLEKLLKYL